MYCYATNCNFDLLFWFCCCAVFSLVWLFETPWTVACQTPLSMGFSRQEYSCICHFLQRIFPNQGLNSSFLHLLHWQTESLHLFIWLGRVLIAALVIFDPFWGISGSLVVTCGIFLVVTCTHLSKVMLKILQVRLQQSMNRELPDVQAGFRKGRGTKDQIANIHCIIKQRVPEKHLLLLYWLCQSLWLCGWWKTVENSSRDGNTRPLDLPPEKFVCRSRSLQLELNMEQQTGSKSGKEYVKAAYCHPAYLTYMQSTSCETPGWMKNKLEWRLLGEISITSDMQMTPPLWQKGKN